MMCLFLMQFYRLFTKCSENYFCYQSFNICFRDVSVNEYFLLLLFLISLGEGEG